ncbi:hypothetical protein [Vibrio campbellii]|uniref:Uncharacterized protein n=1 Tax=Vibrio campbellii TaxID=680 RepID=A0ABY5IAS5_9VIBR|nr:hypothetical protein [Vibrio campbellii]UTZ21751.1 hypothetical protein HB760_07355 [Vibrio campbellii]UTZ30846.1 hypothetical protein HB762_05270 [Vibrio campbellii]
MAAQKLTKARLAQILIMLSLLIGAFFWRTFTYETNREVDCSQKQLCDVTIGTEKIIINKTSNGFSIESSKTDSLKIDLNQTGDFINIDDEFRDIDWNSVSEKKIINFKLNENIVQVHL